MKFKTTAKAVKNGYARIVSAGYCDLQTLLNDVEPVAYTCGVYGWNFDVYYINGLCITTGYRGMCGRRANNITEYESKARAICNDYYNHVITYDEKKERTTALLKEFCAQA